MLLSMLAGLPLLAGAYLWFRDSSLVSVERVQISGVHGPEAGAIEAALAGAARRMSTLDVHPGALRAAVAPFRLVRDVSATPSFPHELRIRVIEQPPVAAVLLGGRRTAVAADGAVLGPALLTSSLPTLAGATGSFDAPRLENPALLAAATVLGAAPGPMARAVQRAFSGPHGLTLVMRNGLDVYFGDATSPHAKWLALVRVLTDPGAAGASYVDVRVPERPAAGFASGAAPSSIASVSPGATGEQAATPEAAAAALTASLGAAAAGGPSPSGREAPSAAAPAGTAATTTQGEATPTRSPEEASAGAAETQSATQTPGG